MQLTSLGKVSDRLRAELSDFTKAFNARLTYFANLQQISDEVADPDMDSKQWRGLLIEIETLRQEERECPLFSSTTDISLTDLPPVPRSRAKSRHRIEAVSSSLSRQPELARRAGRSRNDVPDLQRALHGGHLDQLRPLDVRGVLPQVALGLEELRTVQADARSRILHQRVGTCSAQVFGAGKRVGVDGLPDLQYRKKATPPPSVGEAPQKYIDSHGIEHALAEQAPLLSEMDEPMREAIASIETTTPLSSKSDFIVKHVK